MNKNNIKFFLFFLSLSAALLFLYDSHTKSHKKEILNQERELLSITYNTIVKAYKTHSEIFYTNKINVPEVMALMKKANTSDTTEKNSVRDELYKLLIDDYNSMKLFKIKQLHFHLPNNESFLRFHRPDRYGDNLGEIRETVAYVNKHKEPVSGFEEGKIYNGYRYVYPILDGDKHYGSVEISVSMDEIIKQMKDETSANIEFIIKKDVVNNKVFDNEKKNYAASKISSDYFYEKSISDNSDKLMGAIISKHPNIRNEISKGLHFNFFTSYDEKVYITTIIPIYNKYSKKHVANIIISRPNISLKHMIEKDIFTTIIIILLIALLTYAYYKIQRNAQDFKKKNKTLKEIQKIAKLGSWELDAKTNDIVWSDEVYNIFNETPQSFKPTYDIYLSYVHSDDIEMVKKAFKESIKLKKQYKLQHRVIKKDNSIAYVNATGFHDYDEDGNHVYTIGTIHDVTSVIVYEKKINFIQSELESIANHIPDILFRSKTDNEMTMLFVNNSIYDITGYKAKVFTSSKTKNYRDLIHNDDKKYVSSQIKEALKNGNRYSVKYRIINSIGDILWVRESGKKLINEKGIEIIEGIITDITHQKNSIEQLRKFIDIQDSIVILTNTKKNLFANKKFFDFFGYRNLEEFSKVHSCICDMFIKDDTFFHLGKMLPKEEHWIGSLLNLPGRERIVSMLDKEDVAHVFSVSINNYDPQTYILNFSDITDTMFEKLQLEKKAIRDHLTNAYNRTYFDSVINSMIKNHQNQNGKTGVIIFDIDYFKDVNDNYGHNVGDDILKTVVQIVNRFTRKDDRLIRWGGEEFLIIMYAKTIRSLVRQAEHLRSVIENHKFENIKTLSCSFGVAIHDIDSSIEETIDRADKKLYEAKRNGRNQVRS